MIESAKELEAAQLLLGHYGVSGFGRPGSFTTAWITAMEKADPTNKAKMLVGFPEYRPAIGILSSLGAEALAVIVRDCEKVQQERAARFAAAERERRTPPSMRIIGRLDDDK
jgi:hypothetical protein